MVEAPSPTDVFTEPACSFCATPAPQCRVLLKSETSLAFICDRCAPSAAAQVRDILKTQETDLG